ncbi:MAG TPA: hypothetical protein VHD61_06600 [Lacunisphaera sp.]|nr:hypothetical protein [Lacunisphaera sp.]
MSTATDDFIEMRGKLAALRTELADLAFELDTRGHADAADVATTVAVRLGELCAEAGAEPDGESH